MGKTYKYEEIQVEIMNLLNGVPARRYETPHVLFFSTSEILRLIDSKVSRPTLQKSLNDLFRKGKIKFARGDFGWYSCEAKRIRDEFFKSSKTNEERVKISEQRESERYRAYEAAWEVKDFLDRYEVKSLVRSVQTNQGEGYQEVLVIEEEEMNNFFLFLKNRIK